MNQGPRVGGAPARAWPIAMMLAGLAAASPALGQVRIDSLNRAVFVPAGECSFRSAVSSTTAFGVWGSSLQVAFTCPSNQFRWFGTAAMQSRATRGGIVASGSATASYDRAFGPDCGARVLAPFTLTADAMVPISGSLRVRCTAGGVSWIATARVTIKDNAGAIVREWSQPTGPAPEDRTTNISEMVSLTAGTYLLDVAAAIANATTIPPIQAPTGQVDYDVTFGRIGPCVADIDDGSGTGVPDGGVTIDDLLYYLQLFEAGDVAADTDDGSGTGVLDDGVTIDDLLYYLLRFEAGC